MHNKVNAINNRILDLKKKLKKSKAGAYRDELLQEVFDLRDLKKEVTEQEILDFDKAFEGFDIKMDDFDIHVQKMLKEPVPVFKLCEPK